MTTTGSQRREFTAFVITGGLAALVNVVSRVGFSTVVHFELAVLLAYGCGMLTAYLLARRFVFVNSRVSVRRSFAAFCLVNAFAVLQTWVVSLGLRNWLLPLLGIVVFRDLIAHAIGVAVPVVSSYFGHKHISFRDHP
ncbi:GtrA family protein [Synechococcus sp. Tobar12-5m-g]|uniref:GtrA family protein n=1 Tax=unclassified Synechococcus TaxID=2626047 RepID=UPI0020CD7B66|nr:MULTISPECIES: GtrA family protein [unclassified Synechococcus]MCP9771584.1 GtrA family protein [Synechococcus sp. Tobar12-5m-g]MCP9872524.1 GtrA family protein [Synechococcus sp. Cruz CV-v-12]